MPTPILDAIKQHRVSATPSGLDFIRLGIADALANPHEEADFAAKRWGENARVTRILKASVPGISTGTGAGDAMVDDAGVRAEFFDTVRAASVIGKLPLHRVPFETRMLSMDEGPIVSWRKEGAAYGNSPLKMTNTAGLARYDLGALMVVSRETLMDQSSSAELTIRDQLVKSLAAKLDADFLDPANSGTAGTKPASVTSGAGSSVSPQESMFDFSDEFQGDPTISVILLNPYQAARLYGAARPDVGARGGTWGGFPVLTSTAVPDGFMVLLDPSQIALALGEADIRASENAMVDMVDSSSMTSAATVAQSTGVSMFQVNCLAIIGSISANWRVMRDDAVMLYDLQSYGLAGGL